MYITGIEKLPRKKNKIFIDGEYAFMLYDRDMAQYRLDGYDETGGEITVALYDRIMKETVIRRAHQKALAMLERMDRSEAELKRRLKLDLYSDEVITETINWLNGHHYLDDERYAENYIRSHMQGSSRRELVAKLLAKGISKEYIDTAYDVCSEEFDFGRNPDNMTLNGASGNTGSIEREAAVKALSKKLGSRKTLTPKERMNAIGYMLRKGFRRNEIMEAFEVLDVSIDSGDIPDES